MWSPTRVAVEYDGVAGRMGGREGTTRHSRTGALEVETGSRKNIP